MSTTTTHYDLIQPGVGDAGDADLWGGMLNDDLDIIDEAMYVGAYSPTSNKTTTYTVLTSDQNKLITGDATSAGFTITLPSAATVGTGWKVSFKKTDATANVVTIDGDGSETIDGSTTYTLTSQNQGVTLDSDGTNWKVISTAAGASSPGVLPVEQGGTGATTAAQARTNLGLGTMAVQNANAVAITGGTATLTSLTVSSSASIPGLPVVTNSANGKIVMGAVTIQWGTIAVAGASFTVTFHTAFSTTPYFISAVPVSAASDPGESVTGISNLSSTTVKIYLTGNPGDDVLWMAIGPT